MASQAQTNIGKVLGTIILILSLATASKINEEEEPRCPVSVNPCSCDVRMSDIIIKCVGIYGTDLQIAMTSLKGIEIHELSISDSDISNFEREWLEDTIILHLTATNVSITVEKDEPTPFYYLSSIIKGIYLSDVRVTGGMTNLGLSNLEKLSMLYIINSNLESVSKTLLPSSLELLVLQNNKIKILEAGTFGTLEKLISLSVRQNLLEYIERNVLPEQTSLEYLEISDNRLRGFSPDFFTNMPNLKVIRASNNDIKFLQEEVWSDVWTNLKIIDINGNPLVCNWTLSWIFDLGLPKDIVGTCAEPENLKGMSLKALSKNDL
ncbi:toll-like receptor 9 [Limulus polyphemus]|uniref:Toll-like receptor 9 n=1 Tax=Limulus polyphemus TaxID=6850 RepID=A0ABM1BSD3_LIMPO|nr:toll-like receptor 9 [Limulus polyphemus]